MDDNDEQSLVTAFSRKNLAKAIQLLQGRSRLNLNKAIDRSNGASLLHFACWNDWLDVAKRLCDEHHFDPNTVRDFNQLTPLHYACRNNSLSIVEYLVQEKECRANEDLRGNSPLFHACQRKNSNTSDKVEVLMLAAKEGNVELLRNMIEDLHCDPNVKDGNKQTPIRHACRGEHISVIRYLVNLQVYNLDCGDIAHTLFFACKRGYLDIVSVLGDHVHGVSIRKRTPFHYGCRYGHIDIVKYLTGTQNIDQNVKDENGKTGLQYARQYGHTIIVHYLESKDNHEPFSVERVRLLCSACRSNCLFIVQHLIDKKGYNPQIAFKDKQVPLHYACSGGSIEVVEYLIDEQGCDPEIRDANQQTPLHHASKHGHTSVVRYLINEHHCDPMVSDVSSMTPLHYASKHKHINVVMFLLRCLKIPQIRSLLQSTAQLGYVWLLETLFIELAPVISNCRVLLTLACMHSQVHVIEYIDGLRLACDSHQMKLMHFASQYGKAKVVEFFIKKKGFDPDEIDHHQLTPLNYACLYRQKAVVELFISIDPKYGQDPFVQSCMTRHHDETFDDDNLFLAIKEGQLHIVKFMVTKMYDGKLTDVSGEGELTPLHYACVSENIDIVNFLCTLQSYSFIKDVDRMKVLLLACKLGHIDLVKSMCTPVVMDVQECAPLCIASSHGHLSVVQYLIDDVGYNPYSTDQDGLTPLLYACSNERMDVVRYLFHEIRLFCWHELDKHEIEQVAIVASKFGDLNLLKDIDGIHQIFLTESLLSQACQGGHIDVVLYLIMEKGPLSSIKPIASSLIFQISFLACIHGKVELIQSLLEVCEWDPEMRNKEKVSLMHYSSQYGHTAIVEYLNDECKCDAEIRDASELTPLHYACKYGQVEVVKYLTNELKCSRAVEDQNHHTPLYYACLNQHSDIIEYLLSDPSHFLSDEDRNQVLLYACEKGDIKVLKLSFELHHCCVDITLEAKDRTPLHFACLYNHKVTVDWLLSQGNCNHEAIDEHNLTPLDYACLYRHTDIVSTFVEKGLCKLDPLVKQFLNQPNLTMADALTLACAVGHLSMVKFIVETEINTHTPPPLFVACESGNVQIVQYLIGEGLWPPELRDKKEMTPLHYACQYGHIDVVQYLFTLQGCNAEVRDIYHQTPLHYACRYGHTDIVRYLVLKQGYNLGPLDTNQLTPLDYACLHGHKTIVDIFINETSV